MGLASATDNAIARFDLATGKLLQNSGVLAADDGSLHLVLVGAVLPLADLIAGHPIRFEPRWNALPPEFWNFLAIGMGGYVGGRSLQKVAGMVMGNSPAQNWASKREKTHR